MREPDALAARPHRGGLPIPYVTAIVDGVPDFRVHDAPNRKRCDDERLCQLCGTPLARRAWFFGLERQLTTHRFAEPPAHEDCSRYAIEVCPWLGGRDWREDNLPPGSIAVPRAYDAPARVALCSATSWSTVRDYVAGVNVYLVGPIADVELIRREARR